MLRTKMPPLSPPPLNNSPLHDLDIMASQQDVRHVRISFIPNLAVHKLLQTFLGHLHCPTSLTTNAGALQAKYHTSTQARSIVHSFVAFCANTFDPQQWRPKPTLLAQRPQHQTSSISTWMTLIENIPNSMSYELCHLPGKKHAHPPITILTQQNEPPFYKRPRLSTTQQWLHETNGSPAVALNPPITNGQTCNADFRRLRCLPGP
jgi:hypothetical protein